MTRHGQTGDPDDVPSARSTDCRMGGRCDGSGWVQVQPAYAAQRHPYPPPPELDASDDDLAEHARHVRRVDAARAAAIDSYYPCKECNPDAFFRWVGGHFSPGHDAAACPDCALIGRRVRRSAA
jgi:hypothetical protein